MVDRFKQLEEADGEGQLSPGGRSPERTLQAFRYVVASVNESALSVWADLWEQLEGSVAPGGLVPPEREGGFKPSCGWPEFLEKFWLLKHYLDYTHRFCSTYQ